MITRTISSAFVEGASTALDCVLLIPETKAEYDLLQEALDGASEGKSTIIGIGPPADSRRAEDK